MNMTAPVVNGIVLGALVFGAVKSCEKSWEPRAAFSGCSWPPISVRLGLTVAAARLMGLLTEGAVDSRASA